ncbi:hypothetical protein M378DRAFT_162915 [Amanita muscaria Koide BX008]|uniref:Uncharacterized protein n=1 Tax=Amanita muscaria (strain Koide BX008) TaxID=946122 RepID=A0A0C2X7M8_AMAMK|nr:hypothetical protein M378DRAFT_162915 [Amanita muscaria Koide BX008]
MISGHQTFGKWVSNAVAGLCNSKLRGEDKHMGPRRTCAMFLFSCRPILFSLPYARSFCQNEDQSIRFLPSNLPLGGVCISASRNEVLELIVWIMIPGS